MTMNNFIEKFDDCLNAILVKELRQTVRGKFFWGIFLIYLGFICLILFFALNETNRYNMFYGDSVASFLLVALYFMAGLLVPIKIGKKTSSEIGDATNELLYTTTMTPLSIVTGKFLCGAVIILMLYAALVPFLSLTLFMGGVDLLLLIILLVFSFMLSNLAVIWQICLGLWVAPNSGESSSMVNTVFGSIIHLGVWITSLNIAGSIVSDFRYDWKASTFWISALIFISSYLFVGGMLFGSSVSKLEPETSNKMYTTRIVASIAWMIGTVITSFCSFEAVEIWTVIVFIALMLLSIIIVSEPEVYSQRIISEIPDSIFNRFSKFPFFTGLVNGECWIFFIAALTLMVAFIGNLTHSVSRGSDFITGLAVLACFLLHVNAYGLVVNFIYKTFSLKRSGIPQITLAAFFITNAVTGISYNMFFWHGGSFSREVIQMLNPFFMLDRYRDSYALGIIGAIMFFALGIILNIKSITKQFNAYFNKGYF